MLHHLISLRNVLVDALLNRIALIVQMSSPLKSRLSKRKWAPSLLFKYSIKEAKSGIRLDGKN